MKPVILTLSAAFAALAAPPAVAQDAAPPTAGAPAPVDPARLAAAKIAVGDIFPPGTYARLMNGSMAIMMDSIAQSSGQLPLSEVAALAGQPPAELAKLGKTTIADIMTILDPVHDQRTSIIMHTTMAALTNIMSELEPSIREGLAQAYARRFTLPQLSDMNRFFATPSGQAYAANVMTIQTDPAVLSRMQAIAPVLMKQLPAIMDQSRQATAKLPPPRKFADLSAAERNRLAALLGIPEAQLEASARPGK